MGQVVLLAFVTSIRYNARVKYPQFAAGKYSCRVSEHPEAILAFGCFFIFAGDKKFKYLERNAYKAHVAFAACAFLYICPSSGATNYKKELKKNVKNNQNGGNEA